MRSSTNRENTAEALGEAAGVTVTELPPEEKDEWVAAAELLFEEFGQESEATAEMITEIRGL